MRLLSPIALVISTALFALAPGEIAAQNAPQNAPPNAPESVLERLAREWTTGYAEPVCKAYNGSRGLLRSCVQRPAGSTTDSLMSQWYDETGPNVALVGWSRGFTDNTQAVRAVAELERALELRRMAGSDCAEVDLKPGLSRSSMWTGSSLGVMITRFDLQNGIAKIDVIATSITEEMPFDVLCREPKRRPSRS